MKQRWYVFALLIGFALVIGACGGDEEGGDSGEQVVPVAPPESVNPEPPVIEEVGIPYEIHHVCDDTDKTSGLIHSPGPNYHCGPSGVMQWVDTYACTNEYEQAVAYARTWGLGNSIPELWNVIPFIVDISDSFDNAYDLLEMVKSEAERVRLAIGYDVFIAGDVIQLDDLSVTNVQALGVLPPDQHVEIRCCHDGEPPSAGISYPQNRVVLLQNYSIPSKRLLMHELYHLLGFSHPGDVVGIEMSEILMTGSRLLPQPKDWPRFQQLYSPTQPSANDLAKLACVFDGVQ